MRGVNPAFWQGRRVLVTGHTGFKGGWLALWLAELGARVHGLALAPAGAHNLFSVARVQHGIGHRLGDITDAALVRRVMADVQPEVVLHLAAQPLVRASYDDPLGTYATNVMGTANVLDAVRHTPAVRAVVNVTTDKCYENREWRWGYREDEALGGHDPYSSSKGCSELITSAYRRSFLADGDTALASARAGNVIGGGDWAAERLVPDVLAAFAGDRPVVLRNPGATRPWQHVLEPLAGYLMLAQALHAQGQRVAEAFNFGPHDDDARPVSWIVERLAALWGPGARWDIDNRPQVHEAHQLKLDCAKARQALGWRPVWALDQTLTRIVAWQHAWHRGDDMRRHCLQEINDYTLASQRTS